jgi:hypothetical protein
MSMELRHGEVTYWEQADWAGVGPSEMVRTNEMPACRHGATKT